ncbi:MAG: SpaA isopeptide-forming pilin-related protein [Bifidobacterium animalis]|nr:SpaA isopeptide-forming pilin-related protein [Bifidobacterium animalis]
MKLRQWQTRHNDECRPQSRMRHAEHETKRIRLRDMYVRDVVERHFTRMHGGAHVEKRRGLNTKGKALALVLAAILLAMVALAGGRVAWVQPTAWANHTVQTVNDGKCEGIQTPTIGASGGVNDDSGIATWVGRDMYVGKPKNGATEFTKDNGHDHIDGSYAMEAEGLTAINGKLAIRGIKGWDAPGSWADNGFRFGVVGFGAMFRPKPGSDALVVAGNSNRISLQDGLGNDTNVASWGTTGRAFVRGEGDSGPGNNGEPGHTARIKVNDSGFRAKAIWETDKDGVYAFDNNWPSPAPQSSYVNWDTAHDLDAGGNVMKKVQLNKAWINENTKTWTDISSTTTEIQTLSENLKNLLQDPGVTVIDAEAGFAPAESKRPVRRLYNDYYYYVEMEFKEHSEKLITFDGKNGGKTLVFNLPASMLTNAHEGITTNGISFKFKNIPDDAVVVVNVTGDDAKIEFNHGWRFWWGSGENPPDISTYYQDVQKTYDPENYIIDSGHDYGSAANRQTYSNAAAAIMWNFADSKYVSIMGGKITEDQNAALHVWNNKPGDGQEPHDVETRIHGNVVTDDPATNSMGSFLVPNGSLETHVSTNGRVWVGEDYLMHNPIGLEQFKANNAPYYFDGQRTYNVTSASIIGQDQERHSFPWRGEHSTSCSTIAWKKVSDDGQGTPLPGTTWGVYTEKDRAIQKTQPTYVVTDNGDNDASLRQGEILVRDLRPDTDFYIREIATVDGYELNENIYVIHTGVASDIMHKPSAPFTAIKAVYGKDDGYHSNILAQGEKDLLYQFPNGAPTAQGIKNVPYKFSIIWEKIDSTSTQRLPNVTWRLERYSPGAKGYVTQYETVADCYRQNNQQTCPSGSLDRDNAAGKFELKNLITGWYRLAETAVPTGYEGKQGTYYYFHASTSTVDEKKRVQVIRKGGETFNLHTGEPTGNVSDVVGRKITNDRKLGAVRWLKVDSGVLGEKTPETLAGSEWQLKRYDTKEDADAKRNVRETRNITDCVLSTGQRCPAGSNDQNPRSGRFELANLQWGHYVLTETKAPDGYNLSTLEYTFTVDANNLQVTEIKILSSDMQAISYRNGWSQIGNEPGVMLPATGAEGRHLWPAIVGALFVLASFGCAVALRMRE